MASSPVSIWEAVSDEFANATEVVGRSVVAVHGRHRFGASGIQWRKGVIVTAEHAVRGADEIKVNLGLDKFVTASLAGRDPSTDLAVLKVRDELPLAAIEPSPQLKLGQLVLALARSRRGNVVASSGIIGGLSGELRTWRGGRLDQHIRLALNLYPGFSGGPLVNAKRQVVGINSSAIARGRAIIIPVATVNRVVDELLERGHIARPYLGLAMQPVDLPQSIASKLPTRATRGLLIVHSEPGGPSEKAGVLIGDIVVGMRDELLHDVDSMQQLLLSSKIGDSIAVTVLRAGSPLQLSIAIGERPER